MSISILVIEDETNIRNIISDYFRAENYKVIEAYDGKMGLEKFEEEQVDLVILDIMMPKLDGWTVCRRIRKKSHVPIIILTARTEEDDELMGFELKADDYVKKPFSPAILVARAKGLLSRKTSIVKEQIKEDKRKDKREDRREENNLIKQGLIVNKLTRQVLIDDEKVELTPKEFEILCYLVENEGMVFSRDQILNAVWGYDFIGDTRIVDNHIKKLRKALKDKAYYIRTVFGVGYKFEVE